MIGLQNNESSALTAGQFSVISEIAHKEAGLVFPDSKASLVSSRLVKRLRALDISDFDDYCNFVTSTDGKDELRLMISALTTNISSFYREDHHFTALRETVLPELIARARSGGRVRFWSAGSSVGMEAYSMAMTILEALPDAPKYDLRILASDIDPNVLEVGRNGIYDDRQLEAVPDNIRAKYFQQTEQSGPGKLQANEDMRALVSFRELNLLENWPISGKFDAIFCRNTVIYFDDDTQRKLWPRFQNALVPTGWLFVGHSERVPDDSGTDFETCGMTIYQRTSKTTTGPHS
jgi:chemotaxis protein methyltransferase CheR